MEKQPTSELTKAQLRQSLVDQLKNEALVQESPIDAETNQSIDTAQPALRTKLADVERDILEEQDKSGEYTPAHEIKFQHALFHIVKTVEHDTTQGVINWDKGLFKDNIKQPETDPQDTRNYFNQVREWAKNAGIKVLNSNVVDYLLQNPDQIPTEWEGKSVVFLGTIFNDYEYDFADCLQLKEGDEDGKPVKKWRRVIFTQQSGNSYSEEDKKGTYVAYQP
jgi:hypothetical protein